MGKHDVKYIYVYLKVVEKVLLVNSCSQSVMVCKTGACSHSVKGPVAVCPMVKSRLGSERTESARGRTKTVRIFLEKRTKSARLRTRYMEEISKFEGTGASWNAVEGSCRK